MRRSRFRHRLRDELHAARPPRAAEAERRAWEVVRAAHAERADVRPPRRGARRLAVAALAAALAAVVALTPAGAKVGDWIGDVVDPAPDAAPTTLGSLPAEGRLLVVSPGGPWVVQDDGARRRLGDFDDATWSPGGLYVAAARRNELVALEPDGDEVWSRPGPGRVLTPRWSPDGFRIAYRRGRDLWIAVGDNSGNERIARGVGDVPPAWKPRAPSPGQVVAFASGRRIRIVEVEGPSLVGATPRGPVPRELWWTANGRRLLAVSNSRDPGPRRPRASAAARLAPRGPARDRLGAGRGRPPPGRGRAAGGASGERAAPVPARPRRPTEPAVRRARLDRGPDMVNRRPGARARPARGRPVAAAAPPRAGPVAGGVRDPAQVRRRQPRGGASDRAVPAPGRLVLRRAPRSAGGGRPALLHRCGTARAPPAVEGTDRERDPRAVAADAAGALSQGTAPGQCRRRR